jgi:DNA-binding NtrC family response regulator
MARILLVDDDDAVLGLLRRFLERQGYEVETASTAEEALVLFEANPNAFALLVADLTLRGTTGEELLEQMRSRRRSLAGVIMSGYPYEARHEGVRFLQKPFLPQALAVEIEKLLKR